MLGLLYIRTKLNPIQEARPRRKQAPPGIAERHQTHALLPPHAEPASAWDGDVTCRSRLRNVIGTVYLSSQVGVMEFEFF